MITDLKPYAEYRESSAPWFGEVPAHWNVKRLGSVFAERGETNENRELVYILSVLKHRGVIPYAEKGRIGNKASDDIGRYKIVRPDDLVVNCMNVIIGSLGRSRYTGCLSPVYYVLRRRDERNDPRYLELVFQHKQFHESLIRIGNGILAHRMRIPMEKLKSEMIPLPSPDEQAAIVRFLDWANGRLERAIRAKRKVIALLNEQKQAIIHRAVTRGLDPSVPLKDSGVDWTPEIPTDWNQYPLRRLALCENSGSYGHEPNVELRELPVATTAQIDRNGRFDVGRMPRRGFTPAEVYRFCCKPGDILVVKSSGSAANVISGKCGIVGPDTPPFVYSNFLARFVANASLIRPQYLYLLLTSYITRERVKRMVSTTTYPNLRMGEYRGALLPVPPLEEQERILEAVGAEVASVDQAIGRLEREITLLREYRTRLVADVVTGKLDVRTAAAAIPDEEPLDDATSTPDSDDDAFDTDDLTESEDNA